MGQYQKSLAQTLEELRLDPNYAAAHINLVAMYSALNDLGKARSAYEQAQAHNINHPFLHGFRYGVAFLEGDAAEMQRQLAWSAGKPGAEDLLLAQQSSTEGFFGRLARAREFSRRAVESAWHSDLKETAAEWQANAALREAEFGNPKLAQQETASALALASTRDAKILAALTLARAGDSARAEKIANGLAMQFPLNTVLDRYWLPTINASIEINRNRPARAIELLQPAAPYELGAPLPEPEVLGLLYPIYVRGQAYLLLHQGDNAAAEFQKFLDHRGIVQNCPLGALARLGLARAHALAGDTTKARAKYQDFLTLWKDADPDIPILKQSKAEYAKLQ